MFPARSRCAFLLALILGVLLALVWLRLRLDWPDRELLLARPKASAVRPSSHLGPFSAAEWS